MEGRKVSSAESSLRKFNEFFQSLDEDERDVISEMVRAALIQAAERFEGADPAVTAVPGAVEAFPIPSYVVGLTGQNAPALVGSLRLPGSLAAHSIPGCNASALVALKVQAGELNP
jgi:hypothetical protein